jgi:hypothetical protein
MKNWKQVLVVWVALVAWAGAARADRIVYDSYGSTDEIWMANIDGTQIQAVENHPDTETNPCLSSDGSRIVFKAYNWNSVGTGGYTAGIDVMNSDGTGRHRLTPPGMMNLGDPKWSPDNSEIVFRAYGGSSGNNCLFLMNADGSNLRRITTDEAAFSPVWSADGKRIAYYSRFGADDYRIAVIDRSGALIHSVSRQGSSYSSGLAWSPDGQWFVAVTSGLAGMQLISYDGSVRHQLPAGHSPSISPDGNTIIYTAVERGGSVGLKFLDLRSGQSWTFPEFYYGSTAYWSAAPAIPAPVPTATPVPTPTAAPTPTPVPNQAPLVHIAAPANGSIARGVSEIRGLLLDDTFGERPALRVTLRLLNGPYWNGRAFQNQPFNLATAQIPLPTTPYGSLWRVTTPLPTPGQLREGLFVAEAVATDKEGLFSRSVSGVRIDLTPPEIVLTSVNFNNTRSSLSGTWRDGGRVQSVFIQIRRANNTFWNGLRWQAAPVLLPAALTNTNSTGTGGSFSLSANLPPERELAAGSLLSILAIDRAGNRAGLQRRIGPVPSTPRT